MLLTGNPRVVACSHLRCVNWTAGSCDVMFPYLSGRAALTKSGTFRTVKDFRACRSQRHLFQHPSPTTTTSLHLHLLFCSTNCATHCSSNPLLPTLDPADLGRHRRDPSLAFIETPHQPARFFSLSLIQVKPRVGLWTFKGRTRRWKL